MRLELTTSAVTGRRSNQLSHWAIIISKVEGLHPQNHRKYRKRRVGRPHFGWPSGQLLDLLVSVSSVHYCTSTSDLSTSSSSRGLTDLRQGCLILRGASRLDAFSVYPFQTWLPSYAFGKTTGTPEVRPTRSSRTKVSSSQTSSACAG